jgi:hypothetical protein
MKTKNNKLAYFIIILGLLASFNSSVAKNIAINPPVNGSAPVIISAFTDQITNTSATLNGTVNPNGTNAVAWFDIQNGTIGFSSSSQSVSSSNNAPAILTPYVLNDLTLGTSYKWRVVASNSFGTTTGDWILFTTLSNGNGSGNGTVWGRGGYPPYHVSVFTKDASQITDNSAFLNGSINPNNYPATTWFEYGTSPTLLETNSTNQIPAGSAGYISPFSQTVTNLSPNTTYYFRAVGSNYAGVVKSTIFSFTTTEVASGINPSPTIAPTTQNTNNNNTAPSSVSGLTNQEKSNLLSSAWKWLLVFILVLVIAFIIAKARGKKKEKKTP